jgi:hypothetical protein
MKRAVLPLLAALLLTSAPAAAGPGFRVGLTDDPDSVFVGGFYEVPVGRSRSGFFALQPAVDLGFIDDRDGFSIRGSLDGKYFFPVARRVAIYPLIGISLYYLNLDCPNGYDCDGTDVGLDAGVGFRVSQFDLQLYLGIEDIPDVTFSVGFVF